MLRVIAKRNHKVLATSTINSARDSNDALLHRVLFIYQCVAKIKGYQFTNLKIKLSRGWVQKSNFPKMFMLRNFKVL